MLVVLAPFLPTILVLIVKRVREIKQENIKDVELFGGKAEEGESQPIVKRTNKVSTLSFRALSVKTKLKDGIYKKVYMVKNLILSRWNVI